MDYDKICDMCLKEMFRRVGRKYPDKKFTDQPDWFTKVTWTKKQEDSFRVWMTKLLTKKCKWWNKKSIDKEISMFLLMWGWKNEEV